MCISVKEVVAGKLVDRKIKLQSFQEYIKTVDQWVKASTKATASTANKQTSTNLKMKLFSIGFILILLLSALVCTSMAQFRGGRGGMRRGRMGGMGMRRGGMRGGFRGGMRGGMRGGGMRGRGFRG